MRDSEVFITSCSPIIFVPISVAGILKDGAVSESTTTAFLSAGLHAR